MSRIVHDELPPTYGEAREILGETLRALRAVLDRGFRVREQLPCVVDVAIDTSALPLSLDMPGVRGKPLAVLVLAAVEQRADNAIVISSPAVSWEWRAGRLVLHAVGTLAAATRYDAVIAVME
jgi:hypothetical protein